MNSVADDSDLAAIAKRVLRKFESSTGLVGLRHEILSRSTGSVLLVHMSNPTERHYSLLASALNAETAGSDQLLATLKKTSENSLLQSPEVRLFLRVLSESLTITRHTFSEDFFNRYIKSVTGVEDQVVSAANHIIFGRRGSGKSSLLLWAMHGRKRDGLPFAWIDMQVYAQREDRRVFLDVLLDVLEQTHDAVANRALAIGLSVRVQKLRDARKDPAEQDLRRLLPDLKRLFGSLSNASTDLVLFLDDFHVLDPSLQPHLLHFLYGFARGTRVFLKVSAIETFTKLWDAATRTGLEVPHDVQLIELDYNLTTADKARAHIQSILDAHALYCGLPPVVSLCIESDVISRLVWVSAGVPRDALNIFSQAITKAVNTSKSRVTITNVNVAASELVNDKVRFMELDSSGVFAAANQLLDRIRTFCLRDQKKNAFLVEERLGDPEYKLVRQLVELRLLHVIHEGIVKREAQRKHVALILDYGFYVGQRKARGVDLFNPKTASPKYEDLRKLPVFPLKSHSDGV